MSYHLWVQSPAPEAVSREVLASDLRRQGWEIQFLSRAAMLNNRPPLLIPQVGLMNEDLFLLGWRPEWGTSPQIEAALAAEDVTGIVALLESESAYCTWIDYQTTMEGHEYAFNGRTLHAIFNSQWIKVVLQSLARLTAGEIVDTRLTPAESLAQWGAPGGGEVPLPAALHWQESFRAFFS